DPLIRGSPFSYGLLTPDVIHQPGHGRAGRAVFRNQTGALNPGSAIDIAPDGDASHVRMVPEHREVSLEVLQLHLIIVIADIVFRNVDGLAHLVPDIVDRGFNLRSGHTLQLVRLQ